jgi:transcription antitermination factor NusG
MLDMFTISYVPPSMDLFQNQPKENNFYWIVGVFSGNGALEAIRRAIDYHLQIYYPHKLNQNNQLVPLWKNYLFIEYVPKISVQICRNATRFIKIISIDGEPVLVRHDAIDESLQLLKLGKYNDRVTFIRRFYERGSLIRVIEGNFADKKVKLEMDIVPDMPDYKKVKVSIGNWSGRIELFKLAL